jgi:hypothetical protein
MEKLFAKRRMIIFIVSQNVGGNTSPMNSVRKQPFPNLIAQGSRKVFVPYDM